MNDEGSNNGGAAVGVGLILILFLLIVGAAIYFFVVRQHTALAVQAEQALLAEAQARKQVEQARAAAELAVVAHATSNDNEASTDQDASIRAAVESILRAQEEA